MNKRKFSIILASSALSIGILATSFAFVFNLDEAGDINVSGNIVKKDTSYTLTKKDIKQGKISPLNSIIHTYTLGISKDKDFTQDTIVSNLELKLNVTGLTSNLDYQNFFKTFNVDLNVKNYFNQSYYLKPEEKLDGLESKATKCFRLNDSSLTGIFNETDSSFSLKINKLVYKDNQDLDIIFKMKDGAKLKDLKGYEDKKISYELSLDQPNDLYLPHIRGNFKGTNHWNKDKNRFAFTYDLDSSIFQYKYIGLKVNANDLFNVNQKEVVDTLLKEHTFGPQGKDIKNDYFDVKSELENETSINLHLKGDKLLVSNNSIFK